MKICPRCQKTYSDENLNFCLDDGAVLTQANNTGDAVPPTIMTNQARSGGQPFGSQSGAPNNWNAPNQFGMQSPQQPPKSKAWLWVVGILGGLMLLCGGGFVGLVFLGSRLDNKNSNRGGIANSSNYNSIAANANKPTNNPPFNSTVAGSVQKVDLSAWAKGDTDLGVTEYTGGEFLMSSKKKNFYFVLTTQGNYKTENATTKVTVRNVNEDSTTLGFGLVVNSNPIPLTQDYAFLIDSENKKYRVVRHTPGSEVVVVGWTRAAAINDGTEKNVLEVRDSNKTMNFYINGEFIRTVGNTDGYLGGVTGLYASDAVQVAFSGLEISR